AQRAHPSEDWLRFDLQPFKSVQNKARREIGDSSGRVRRPSKVTRSSASDGVLLQLCAASRLLLANGLAVAWLREVGAAVALHFLLGGRCAGRQAQHGVGPFLSRRVI